jgi:hypothetical protein
MAQYTMRGLLFPDGDECDIKEYQAATQADDGLMASTDKQNLDGIVEAIQHLTAKLTGSVTATGAVVDSTIDLPTGFTSGNCAIAGFGYAVSASEYRHGNNAFGANERVFARVTSGNKVIVSSNYNGTVYFEVILAKIV